MYYKNRGEKFVFVSSESHDYATFIYTLIGKLNPLLKEIVPNLEMIYYWADSRTSQYRNKTIFKVISYHEEYFNCKASWNYMEAGHGKRLCNPIGGTDKRKADQAVKNERFVIQDAVDFYEWSKQESSAIKYVHLSTEEYEISANFLKALCKNLDSVNGEMTLHAVFSLKPNWIWIRNTSCFCSNCFDHNFRKDSCCKGWRECKLKTIMPFFSFFLLQNFYIVFYPSYVSICKDLQKTVVLSHQALFCKYLHLQYNIFVIYDEAKAVPQRPSHNKVPQKHAANRQGNTSHRSMIPTKLLLCIFVEIALQHGCPHPL